RLLSCTCRPELEPFVSRVPPLTSRRRLRGTDAGQFLARASAVLAASPDAEIILQGLTRLALAAGADFCVVDLVEPDGRFARVAAAHADPWNEARYSLLQRRDAPDPERGPVARALREGQPLLVAQVTGTWLAEFAGDAEHRRLL